MGATKIDCRLPGLSVVSLALLFILSACSDSNNNNPSSDAQKPQADNPVVDGPVTGGGGVDCCVVSVQGFPVNLRDLDYVPGTPLYTFLN
jgi:hypothetical protein